MGLSFFEAMRGSITDADGVERRVEFEVKAEASQLRRFARTGLLRLDGVVHAPPWVDEAPVSGSLELRPVVGRRLIYAFDFADEQGRRYAFWGRKTPSPLRPLHSMTWLEAELRRDGELLGSGVLTFDLAELPAFLASWGPANTIKRLPLDATGLSTADRALLGAFTRAVIAPGRHVPEPDQATVAVAERTVGRMPAPVKLAMLGALRAVDAAVVLRTGRRLTSLDRDRARDVVERLAEGPLGRVVNLAAIPAKVGHFSRVDYLRSIGAPTYEAPAVREVPRWLSQVTDVADLPEESDLEAEVVVIGTGAGGAAAATALAEAGVATLLVEEGALLMRDSFVGEPLDRLERGYRDGGMTFTVGRPPIALPIGRSVGGSTTINSGTCFRTPDHVLGEWRAAGLPDDLEPDRMARWFEAVEAELQVAPNPMSLLGPIAQVVATGAEAMGLEHGPLPRNAPGCDAQGVCALGCPTDAKRSTNVSYVPRALRAGAELLTGLRATRILRRGARIVGIEARGQDPYGRSRVVRIRARAVVLACGTLFTPTLLLENGFRGRWVGRNLSLHPGFGVQARFDRDMKPWHAVPQGYGVSGLESKGIKLEGYWMPPQMSSMQVPMVGRALADWMDDQARVSSFGFMVRDPGVGRVRRGPDGRPLAWYDIDRGTMAKIREGASVLAEILLRGGATEVLCGPAGMVRTVEEARAVATARHRAVDYDLAAFHPLGTCRMAADPADGVVDADHRVFGTDNLYVIDGAAVRSSLGVNPQITILALALRAGERLAERLA